MQARRRRLERGDGGLQDAGEEPTPARMGDADAGAGAIGEHDREQSLS